MAKPLSFAPVEIKISYYKKHNMYLAGTKARVTLHGMVGVKDNEIVDITYPNSDPHIIISNKTTRQGTQRFYASDGEKYYHLERHWNQHQDDTYSVTESIYGKLTTLHQEVVKKVMFDYFTNKLTNDED